VINELENDIPFMSCAPVIVRSSCAQGETAQARTGEGSPSAAGATSDSSPPELTKSSPPTPSPRRDLSIGTQ
jgi:hypothetical protein